MRDHRSLKLPSSAVSMGFDGGQWTNLVLHGPDGITRPLKVVASWMGGWDHASVSLMKGHKTRTPNWNEVEAVRRAFFHPHETVVQIHPPLDDYVCINPGVLHLWRQHDNEHELPPKTFV